MKGFCEIFNDDSCWPFLLRKFHRRCLAGSYKCCLWNIGSERCYSYPRRHRTWIERIQDAQKRPWTSSERLIYVQFMSCVYGDILFHSFTYSSLATFITYFLLRNSSLATLATFKRILKMKEKLDIVVTYVIHISRNDFRFLFFLAYHIIWVIKMSSNKAKERIGRLNRVRIRG